MWKVGNKHPHNALPKPAHACNSFSEVSHLNQRTINTNMRSKSSIYIYIFLDSYDPAEKCHPLCLQPLFFSGELQDIHLLCTARLLCAQAVTCTLGFQPFGKPLAAASLHLGVPSSTRLQNLAKAGMPLSKAFSQV